VRQIALVCAPQLVIARRSAGTPIGGYLHCSRQGTSRIQLPRIFFGPGLGSRQPVRVGDPIERWLELEDVFTIPGSGDVELADDLDWKPGAGLVYVRRLNDSQVWRADFTVTARPHPERPVRWR
jgi:hypothetical protein